MEQTNYRSFKLSHVCSEIQSVITTLKQIQSQMDLKNYSKLQETIQKLEEHKQYIWQIYEDLQVLEWLKNYPGGVIWPKLVLVGWTINMPTGADEECLLPPGFLPPVKGQVASLQRGVDSPRLLPYNIGEGTEQCYGF